MSFERTIEAIASPGVDLFVSRIHWDSEIFGFPIGQIERIQLRSDAAVEDAAKRLRVWLDEHKIRLASCRLESSRLRESMLLESLGFRFIEMTYRPHLSPIPVQCSDERELLVDEANHADLPEIKEIAGNAFSTGRFLLDWRLDPYASHRRYQQWVTNSFESEQQCVLKGMLSGQIIGFFVVEERLDSSAYWHLTAIAPAWQGRGLGKRLWAAVVKRHHDAGLSRIETTISAHNFSVMNIYAALGFKFGAPHMTFHWVRE